MLSVLANRTYRHLFAAQIIALVGTGLMTVALALLAYDLAGGDAGAVLGTALAIKMIAYVSIAPVAGGLAARLPRRAMLVTLDLVRAAVAIALPFVDQVWQIYVLIALLQAASAAFTPTLQATVADILTKESDYTRALSLSRLAYDLENLLSPALAAALISIVGFHWLFSGTVLGFVASAALIVSATLPAAAIKRAAEGVWQRTTRGVRIYMATPRLRALLALNLSVAAAGAMVIVNTVVLIKGGLGMSNSDLAITMAVFGGGSMIAALALPRLLDSVGDRRVMIPAALSLGVLLLGFAAALETLATARTWGALLAVWAVLGFGYSATQVPVGRLLRRSAHAEDRPAIFAAQFALSHACWLITYPLAGYLGGAAGMPITLAALGVIAVAASVGAAYLWPASDLDSIEHEHPELPADHPHIAEASSRKRHAHVFKIDDLHPHWPVSDRMME